MMKKIEIAAKSAHTEPGVVHFQNQSLSRVYYTLDGSTDHDAAFTIDPREYAMNINGDVTFINPNDWMMRIVMEVL